MKAFKKLLLGALMAGGLVACGGGTFDNDMSSRDRGRIPPPAPSLTGPNVTLTDGGVRGQTNFITKRIEIAGDQTSLTVLNSTNMARQFVSRDCPLLNFGVLAPGQQSTVNLPDGWEGCTLYDAMQPNAARYNVTLIPASDLSRIR